MPGNISLQIEEEIKLGNLIRMHRMRMGLSQKDMAQLIGVSFQQVQKYESGDNRISATRLIQISKALNVSISELMGENSKSSVVDPKMNEFISRIYMLKESQRELIYDLAKCLTNYARLGLSPKKHQRVNRAK